MKLFNLSPRTFLLRALAYTALALFGFLMIFPFLYMLFTSFKTSSDVFRYPPALLPLTQATTEYEGAQVPLYNLRVDGERRPVVDTGERERFGFFTDEDGANLSDPRSSKVVAEVPLDEAVETGRTVTVQKGEAEETFDVYEVETDGETQELLLAFRGAQNRFVVPENPALSTYAVERTASKEEYVDFQWENYRAFSTLDLDRALVNTVLVTVLVVLGQLVTSIFGGYAFSRVEFRGRDTLFLLYLGSIMIPFVVLIIPMYRLMVILDWQNQLVALILPWIFTAYGTFFDAPVFHLHPQRPGRSCDARRRKSLPGAVADFCAAERPGDCHAGDFFVSVRLEQLFVAAPHHQRGERVEPRADPRPHQTEQHRRRPPEPGVDRGGDCDFAADDYFHPGAALLYRRALEFGAQRLS